MWLPLRCISAGSGIPILTKPAALLIDVVGSRPDDACPPVTYLPIQVVLDIVLLCVDVACRTRGVERGVVRCPHQQRRSAKGGGVTWLMVERVCCVCCLIRIVGMGACRNMISTRRRVWVWVWVVCAASRRHKQVASRSNAVFRSCFLLFSCALLSAGRLRINVHVYRRTPTHARTIFVVLGRGRPPGFSPRAENHHR